MKQVNTFVIKVFLLVFLLAVPSYSQNLIALYNPQEPNGIVNPDLAENVSSLSINIDDVTFPLFKQSTNLNTHGDLVLETLKKFTNNELFLVISSLNMQDSRNLEKAMNYAYSKGSRIFIVTYGIPILSEPSYKFNAQQWYELFDFCKKCPDMLVLCSAGNDGKFLDSQIQWKDIPSNLMIVGACNSDRSLCKFTNYGRVVDVYTLGHNVKIGIHYNDGTSFSTPIVAAYCSRILNNYPQDSPQQIKEKLKKFAINKVFLNQEIIEACS